MKEQKNSPTKEEQKAIRFKLVRSARQARTDNVARAVWENHPQLKEVCSKYHLNHDILQHIAAFVWTFRR